MLLAVESLSLKEARRLALARAGLLKPAWTDFPTGGRGAGKRARAAALGVIERFGYLQLDTVSIAGARSHGIVLASRLEGFDTRLAEQMLAPGEPLFEYWGHEASWIPLTLYPAFAFRRREFKEHPWWGDVIGEHPKVVRALRKRLRAEGALRSIDLEGAGSQGWWDLKVAKRVAQALWSSGELGIRERKNFQRSFDLVERVVPDEVRSRKLTKAQSFEVLLLKALDGHGFATTGTLAATWRLRNCRRELESALKRLVTNGSIVACRIDVTGERAVNGWIRPMDLELADRLNRVRPRADRGVCLSPFDPLLWDRDRVRRLFDFDQVLEIYKPAPIRTYGYFCLPVLAGERLIARFDLKADRRAGKLKVLSIRFEGTETGRPECSEDEQAARTALSRFASSVALESTGW